VDLSARDLILFLTGGAAGIFGGMLGVGGGFLMNPVQFWILDAILGDPTVAIRMAFGTGLAVALTLSISGVTGHLRRGAVEIRPATILGISGILSGFMGGSVAGILSAGLLRPLFALILITGAAGLYIRRKACTTGDLDIRTHPALLVMMGSFAGFLSGLFGVGGGFVLVPLLVLVGRYPVHRAVGTSAAFIAIAAAGGSFLISFRPLHPDPFHSRISATSISGPLSRSLPVRCRWPGPVFVSPTRFRGIGCRRSSRS